MIINDSDKSEKLPIIITIITTILHLYLTTQLKKGHNNLFPTLQLSLKTDRYLGDCHLAANRDSTSLKENHLCKQNIK